MAQQNRPPEQAPLEFPYIGKVSIEERSSQSAFGFIQVMLVSMNGSIKSVKELLGMPNEFSRDAKFLSIKSL